VAARRKQARALGWEQISKFIDTAGEGIRGPGEGSSDSCVRHDGAARELVALDVDEITFLPDGTGLDSPFKD
jgi:hypothetical protein